MPPLVPGVLRALGVPRLAAVVEQPVLGLSRLR
jgi:hypothetical protein